MTARKKKNLGKKPAAKKTRAKSKSRVKTGVKSKGKSKKVANQKSISSKFITDYTNEFRKSSEEYMKRVDPALKDFEDKMLPKEFKKMLTKIEKMLKDFNTSLAAKLKK